MITNKRNQIRRDIRKEELEQFFALKRKEILGGKHSIFRQLSQAVMGDCYTGINMELVGRLLGCHQAYPQQENSYIVIANYLFDHNEALSYFFSRLVASPYFVEHQMWSLLVIANILSQQVMREDRYKVQGQMDEVVGTASEITSQIVSNLKYRPWTSKQTNIWLYFMDIIKVQLVTELFEEIPHQALSLFTDLLNKMPLEVGKEKELRAIWMLLEVIFKRSEELVILRDLMGASKCIFWLVLKEIPQEREECLTLLGQLITKHSIEFMSTIFCKELIEEMLYLLKQVQNLKCPIVNLMKLLISQCNMDELILLLSKGTHIQLTEAMEWSMQVANNSCLEDCLIAIYNVMSRLQQQHETKLLGRVQAEIETLHFDQMLQGLSSHHQTPNVWRHLSLLIDDFYSSEAL